MFGKPRPDLLSRCQPDLAHLSDYIVGGIANVSSNGQLVSAAICKNTDDAMLNDGFRSYPSGHSSSSAAGLIYLSLFMASKFAITFPFLPSAGGSDHIASTAFPSCFRDGADQSPDSFELKPRGRSEYLSAPGDPALVGSVQEHKMTIAAARRQAAAAPLYLLVLVVLPFFGAVFIAGSRWFDFRHHGFDILFGFLIGTVTAFFAFHFYHLPISRGAGWAWGPRSPEKAFWAGVGSYSYATGNAQGYYYRGGDEEEGLRPGRGSTGHGSALPSLQVTAVGRQPDFSPTSEQGERQ